MKVKGNGQGHMLKIYSTNGKVFYWEKHKPNVKAVSSGKKIISNLKVWQTDIKTDRRTDGRTGRHTDDGQSDP